MAISLGLSDGTVLALEGLAEFGYLLIASNCLTYQLKSLEPQ